MEELSPPSGSPAGDDATALNRRGAAALVAGEFAEALAAYGAARAAATSSGDRDKADLNIAMTRLQMGDARAGEEGLREILLRAPDARTAFHAAYNLACSLRRQARYDRALSYARRAMERAESIGSPEFIAPVHNLLGNVYLNQNYLDEALAEYQSALALRLGQAEDTRFSRAILEENIGYCLILQRRVDDGLACLHRALALADDVGDRRCRAECLQDLCYAHLMDGRLDEAIAEGERALDVAQAAGFSDVAENCHYLLGELGSRSGRFEMRDRHFGALQHLHPEVPFLQDFLCTVDVTELITLKR